MIRSRRAWFAPLVLCCVVAGDLALAQEPPPAKEPAPADKPSAEKPKAESAESNAAEPASKPEPGPTTALVGATILTMVGDAIERGTVLMRDGKIVAVGGDVEVPDGATRIALDGKVVCPGFIDAKTVLGLPASELGAAMCGVGVGDGFDPFDRALERAVAEGVTAAYVTPKIDRVTSSALGAVVKVRPGAPVDETIVADVAAAQVAIGVSNGTRSDTISRWATVDRVRKAFEGAKKYGEAKKKYDESFAKWKKDLAEWREKNNVPVPADEDGDDSAPKKKDEETSKDTDKKNAKKTKSDKREKSAKKSKSASKKKTASKKKSSKKKKKPKRRPKRPKEPRVDPTKEALLDVLAREIPLRIEAHRESDIERALELAEEFNVRLVLDGCTDGASLAGKLKKANATVVVGPLVLFQRDRLETQSFDPRGLEQLRKAGVPVVVTTADSRSRAVRMLRVAAAYAAGCGLGRDHALEAITIDAARALGVDGRIGSIEKGKDADLVVLDKHPLDAGSRVLRVFVGGEALIGGDG